ncbi:PH domain-containing protein [Gorillibacterium timonense]|uniref:PH domain-containing protein n=1 Tax=Gorillibacterium timonense TaxID=1689269 RepID=UPI00071D091F|nr:PH domain-containing protein [Gorillibacterium timonense]
MAFCSNCGQELLPEVKFCSSCGTQVGGKEAQSDERDTPSYSSAPAPGSDEEAVLWEGKPADFEDRLKNMAHLNTTDYTITNQRVIRKSGLIGKKVEEIELLRVKDLSIQQSVRERLFGVGNITILSEDPRTPELILEDVKDVHEVKDIIRKAVREEKARHRIVYRDDVNF